MSRPASFAEYDRCDHMTPAWWSSQKVDASSLLGHVIELGPARTEHVGVLYRGGSSTAAVEAQRG